MPQSSQNADEGAFSAPHFGQRLDSGLPHAAQNFLPVVLSVPHFEQRILYSQIVKQCPGLPEGGEFEALGKPAVDCGQHRPRLIALALPYEQRLLHWRKSLIGSHLRLTQAARSETVGGQDELVLTGLDKLEEPPSLVRLREAVNARLPRVDLPEILLEIAARTDFASKFTLKGPLSP